MKRFENGDQFTSGHEAASAFAELLDIVQMDGKYKDLPQFAVFSYVRHHASVQVLAAALQMGMNDAIAMSAATCADLWEVSGCAHMPKRGELLARSAQATLEEIEIDNSLVQLVLTCQMFDGPVVWCL